MREIDRFWLHAPKTLLFKAAYYPPPACPRLEGRWEDILSTKPHIEGNGEIKLDGNFVLLKAYQVPYTGIEKWTGYPPESRKGLVIVKNPLLQPAVALQYGVRNALLVDGDIVYAGQVCNGYIEVLRPITIRYQHLFKPLFHRVRQHIESNPLHQLDTSLPR